MKVIDLLNRIANREEVPKKIKWGEFELEWEELGYHDYKFLGTGNHLLFKGFATSVLNDEVEIIEEDKKTEKIETYEKDGNIFIDNQCFKYVPIDKHFLTANEHVIVDRINKIIDKINGMENK